MKRLLLLALIALSLPSCDHLRTSTGPPITGSFEYKGFKIAGTIHPTK